LVNVYRKSWQNKLTDSVVVVVVVVVTFPENHAGDEGMYALQQVSAVVNRKGPQGEKGRGIRVSREEGGTHDNSRM